MTDDPTVRLSKAYCSARDQPIPVLVRDPGDSSTEEAPELLSCLDYGVRCTGWLCPLFSVPTLPPEDLLEEAMKAERHRRARDIAQGRAILQRALREGKAEREAALRRREQARDLAAGHGAAP